MYKGNPHRDHPLTIAAQWIALTAIVVVMVALCFRWDPTHGALNAAWRRGYEQHPLLITAFICVALAGWFARRMQLRKDPAHRSLWNLARPGMYLAVAGLLLLLQLALALDAYMTSNNAFERTGKQRGRAQGAQESVRPGTEEKRQPAAQLSR